MTAAGGLGAGAMPTVDDQRKVFAANMIAAGRKYRDIRHVTGPKGLFPLVEKEMAWGTLTNIKQRMERHDDPCFRKRRVDAGTLTAKQLGMIEDALAAKSTASTAEIRTQMLDAGEIYTGTSLTHFPPATIDTAAREMGETYKKAYIVAPDVNPYEVARFHVAASHYPTVSTTPSQPTFLLLFAAAAPARLAVSGAD